MEMGTVALVQAKGQDNAQGPSNQHLWAPTGNKKQLKCPPSHEYDILPPNPCRMRLQQNWYRMELGPKLIQSLRPL